MRILVVAGLALGAACSSAARPANPEPRATTPAVAVAIETGLLPPVRVRGEPVVRQRLADRMRALMIPGVSIAVFERGRVVWAQGYGVADIETGDPVTAETLFQAGSISKSVNALGVLLQVDAGRLALDAPINAALTSWKLPDNALTAATPVTLRHLLSHTAGLTVHGFPGYPTGAPLPTLPQVLDGVPPANTSAVRVDVQPGTVDRYSGGGTTIAQLALVDTLREPYAAILQRTVLAPLGMANSTFEQPLPATRLAHAAAGHHRDGTIVPTKRHVYPEQAAAGLWTTPSDLARFFAEVAAARAGGSRHVPQRVARWMTTAMPPTKSNGLGVFLREQNGAALFGHGGADEGFQASAIASLDGGYGVIVMANSDNGFELFPEIERTVFAAYGWPGADAEIERVALAPAARATWLGRYEHPSAVFELVADGEGIAYVEPFVAPVPLIATRDGLQHPRLPIQYQLTAQGVRLTSRGRASDAARLAPTEVAPLFELAAGRRAEALAAWRALVKAGARRPIADEQRANQHGYLLLREGDVVAAVAVLSLVAEVFPASSNAHDSYGEAAMAAGDAATAIREYERALATLDADASIPADQKPARRRAAERALATLRDRRSP